MNLKNICLFLLLCYTQWLHAENGYELWLRYKLVSKGEFYTSYCLKNRKVMFPGETESLIAAKKELQAGLSGLLNIPYTEEETLEDIMLIVGTPQSVPLFKEQAFHKREKDYSHSSSNRYRSIIWRFPLSQIDTDQSVFG